MASPLSYPIHPIIEVIAQIDHGENSWVCLQSFLHDWWCYAIDQRLDLINDPPLPTHTAEGKRWAAFCAAAVEEVCLRTPFPQPTWLNRPEYTLEQPWYYFADSLPEDYDLSTTPESFRHRNIFVDGSVLDNRYELRQTFGSKPKWEVWSDEELRQLATLDQDVSSLEQRKYQG